MVIHQCHLFLVFFDFSARLKIYSHASCFFGCFQQTRIPFLLFNQREWKCLAEINKKSTKRIISVSLQPYWRIGRIQSHSILEGGEIGRRKARKESIIWKNQNYLKGARLQYSGRHQNSSDLFWTSLNDKTLPQMQISLHKWSKCYGTMCLTCCMDQLNLLRDECQQQIISLWGCVLRFLNGLGQIGQD